MFKFILIFLFPLLVFAQSIDTGNGLPPIMSSAPPSDTGQDALPVRIISQLGAGTSSGGVSSVVSISGGVTVVGPINASSFLSAKQTVTPTESNLAAPTRAVGISFECESLNADNIRWGFSSGTSAILSSGLGVLCEPGRSVDFLAIGTGNFLHMISTSGSLNFMDVQWILSQ